MYQLWKISEFYQESLLDISDYKNWLIEEAKTKSENYPQYRFLVIVDATDEVIYDSEKKS